MSCDTCSSHTAFALFNHDCREQANAHWYWDCESAIPNRIIVKANRDIRKNEEVKLLYFPDEDEEMRRQKAYRLFGRRCDCEKCEPMGAYAVSVPFSFASTGASAGSEGTFTAAEGLVVSKRA